MLLHLHVKNFALIDEIEADFTKGLNIITGETGAGKSIILGSINLALGAKASPDIIRTGAEYALVELEFLLESKSQIEAVKKMELPVEEGGIVFITRKIMPGRNVCKVCGESVSVSELKRLAPVLLDIYGQHDYQSLLKADGQLKLIDSFIGDEVFKALSELKELNEEYRVLKDELDSMESDEDVRNREIDFAKYQVSEIEAANLTVGEEEEVSNTLRRMENSEKIAEGIGKADYLLQSGNDNASDNISRAYRELLAIAKEDEKISEFADRMGELESLLSEFMGDLSAYLEECSYDEETLNNLRERYDLINTLEMKYGKTIEDVLKYMDERVAFIEKMEDYDNNRNALAEKADKVYAKISKKASEITKLRCAEAARLGKDIEESLSELNFMQSKFVIEVSENDTITASGKDKVSFNVSTNVGESLRPVADVASGGELSRIMLGIKTVSAKREEINTLIFDEIDSGISGKTAWQVSKKLGKLSKDHQVICITHLPQIASMADSHFLIEKSENDGKTSTKICQLDSEESLGELARLLGGDATNEAVVANAKDLLAQAENYKQN